MSNPVSRSPGRRTVTVVVGLLAVLALSACTKQEASISLNEQVPAAARADESAEEGDDGDGEAAPSGDAASFTAIDIDFSSFPDAIAAGEVTIELVNEGNLEHNVSIEETGDEVVTALGGETATGQVTLEPGEYTFFCDVPGHVEAMREVITVE